MTNLRESIDPLFFTFDNKRMYASSNRERDKKAIVELDLATAKEGEVLFGHLDEDADGLAFPQARKVLAEINYVTAKPEHKLLDAATVALYKTPEAKLPGYEISLQSHTRDKSTGSSQRATITLSDDAICMTRTPVR